MISYRWAGNGEMWSFHCLLFLSSHSHSHFHSHDTSLAISIPMGIPWESHGTFGIPNIYSSLKSTINSSQSLRQLMNWKLLCRPPGKSYHKNTLTRRWWTLSSADCLHGYGCQWWSLWASAVTLFISKFVSFCYHQQTGSFQSHQLTDEDYARNAEKWGRGLKQHNFVIVTILLLLLGLLLLLIIIK